MEEGYKDRIYHATSKWWYFWILIIFVILGIMLYYFYRFPEEDIGPEQPISFSHRVHAGTKRINCRFCHPFVDEAQNAGLPAMEKCFFCHNTIIPMHPQLAKERWHYKANRPVPWVQIYYAPDYVKFRHQPHIAWANLDCSQCHGPVETMDRLIPVDFKMGFCIGCHRKMNAQVDCWLACHH